MAVAAYRRMREIAGHLGARVGGEVSPGANVTSDADLLKYIQEQGVRPIHHASSTCKMGRAGERLAVVDSHARVLGVQGLRVIDSSSFRFTPPGHTQGYTCESPFRCCFAALVVERRAMLTREQTGTRRGLCRRSWTILSRVVVSIQDGPCHDQEVVHQMQAVCARLQVIPLPMLCLSVSRCLEGGRIQRPSQYHPLNLFIQSRSHVAMLPGGRCIQYPPSIILQAFPYSHKSVFAM